MFHYPYFESDEGTYLSQAWSVEETGKLGLYTYWYDHPPVGWFFIGAWTDMCGGDWDIFGGPLYSGRVLMLILHLVQTALVFAIIRRATGSALLAFLSGIFYTISPMTMYFQRRVLLDNIMVTWVLAAVAVLHVSRIRLRHVLMSGVFYGIAVLSKVTAVMFGPAFLLLLLTADWPVKKHFRTVGWLVVSGSITMLWFVYAVIKTEFFPDPTGGKVSLIGSTLYQASRGTGVPFYAADSSFMTNLNSWMLLDHAFVYIIGASVMLAVVLVVVSKKYRFYALATLLYFYFLIRGGVVIGFYILPLVPFSLMVIAGSVRSVDEFLSKRWNIRHFTVVFAVSVLVVTSIYYPSKMMKYLTVDETSNQMNALIWIKKNLPEDAAILSDIYGLTELLDPSFVNGKVFRNVDWYFKVAKDPAIRFAKYKDDWRNFDYVLISHEMLYQTSLHKLPVVYEAIRNSQPFMRWDANTTSYIDVQSFLSTNGDWAALYKVNGNTETQLLYAWNYYRDHFLESYGQVIDPSNGVTTSEGQAYAMLRAVYMNDEDTFIGTWAWTRHHLQFRNEDKLLSWRWKDDEQVDSNNATDADIDAVVALLFASKKFKNPAYLEDAKEIMDDIWEQTVVRVNGRYYLLPVEKKTAERGDLYLLNPSYFSPGYYRLFAEIDPNPDHEWLKLADDTYATLNELGSWRGNITGLPPDWVMLNARTGEISSADVYIVQGNADNFGFDAFRTLWRVAVDVSWYDSEKGRRYLKTISPFFEREWERRGDFAAIYDIYGGRMAGYGSMAVDSGILSALKYSSDPALSADVYRTLFVDEVHISEEEEYAYWGDPNDYYDSNWVWFGQALFNDNMPNLWYYYD